MLSRSGRRLRDISRFGRWVVAVAFEALTLPLPCALPQTAKVPGERRPVINSLYDVFMNIRDDEAEHCVTMRVCQKNGALQSPHDVQQGCARGRAGSLSGNGRRHSLAPWLTVLCVRAAGSRQGEDGGRRVLRGARLRDRVPDRCGLVAWLRSRCFVVNCLHDACTVN